MDATILDATEMDATEIVTFLRTVPIFHTLSKDQLTQLAEAADVVPATGENFWPSRPARKTSFSSSSRGSSVFGCDRTKRISGRNWPD